MSIAKQRFKEQMNYLNEPMDRGVVRDYTKELITERGILIYTIVFLLFMLIIK